MYGSRNPPEEPPCKTCRVVPLGENIEALRIFLLTQRQYIMGFNGPVDVNHIAVWEAIDRFGIEDTVKVFERVVRCARIMIADMVKKAKDKKSGE